MEILEKADKNAQVCWVQEENMNSGAFSFVEKRINRVLRTFQMKK